MNSGDAGNVLFLDLNPGNMGVFNLSKFHLIVHLMIKKDKVSLDYEDY